ncbi:MAG TPA: ABC transporter permease [Candidatus Acidoferrum sp.]|nr:ABC transporter permease [Candidatus Acidoferrum sp.]
MASKMEGTTHELKRALGFLKIFFKNSRGLVGVIIIVFFTLMAVLAPVLTPYQPLQPFVSGLYAAPTWLKYLPTFLGGMPKLSENFYPINITSFSSVSAGWTFVKNSTNISNLQVLKGFDNSSSCLVITFSRNETGQNALSGISNATLYYDFYFPYQGAPYQWVAGMTLIVNGTSTSTQIQEAGTTIDPHTGHFPMINVTLNSLAVIPQMTLSIERLSDGGRWQVFPWPLTNQSNWQGLNGTKIINTTPTWLSVESDSFTVNSTAAEGSAAGTAVADAEFIASPGADANGWYRYALNIGFLDNLNSTVPVQTSIYVDNGFFSCAGRAFGILGTDDQGRDIWTQLVYGSRISLIVGLLAAVIGVALGLVVGLAAGFMGGAVDEVLMRFSDLLLCIPFLPLMMVLVEILGPNIENLIIIIGFLGWMGFARMIRSQVLSLKERPFIEASKSVGAGRTHIIVRHVLPNVMPLVYITLASSVPGAITLEASLAFLGFYDPTRMSWGRILNGAFSTSGALSWWWVIFPGLCIASLAMAFILLGFALDEVLNPKLRLRK